MNVLHISNASWLEEEEDENKLHQFSQRFTVCSNNTHISNSKCKRDDFFTIRKPSDSTKRSVTCQIELDTDKVKGVILDEIIAVSSARFLELYTSQEEYLGTSSRGVPISQNDNDNLTDKLNESTSWTNNNSVPIIHFTKLKLDQRYAFRDKLIIKFISLSPKGNLSIDQVYFVGKIILQDEEQSQDSISSNSNHQKTSSIDQSENSRSEPEKSHPPFPPSQPSSSSSSSKQMMGQLLSMVDMRMRVIENRIQEKMDSQVKRIDHRIDQLRRSVSYIQLQQQYQTSLMMKQGILKKQISKQNHSHKDQEENLNQNQNQESEFTIKSQESDLEVQSNSESELENKTFESEETQNHQSTNVSSKEIINNDTPSNGTTEPNIDETSGEKEANISNETQTESNQDQSNIDNSTNDQQFQSSDDVHSLNSDSDSHDANSSETANLL